MSNPTMIERVSAAMIERRQTINVLPLDRAMPRMVKAGLKAMAYDDDMEGAFISAALKHRLEPITFIEAYDDAIAALAEEQR